MMLKRFGFLLATFSQERKHQVIKKFLQPRRNTRGLERGIMEELTLQHLYELRTIGSKRAALQDPRLANRDERSAILAALPHATNENIMVSGAAIVRCRKIMSRDVVLYTRADGRALGAGEVLWHAAVADDRWTCVAVWEVLDGVDAGDSSRYIKCRVREDETRLLPTSLLLESVVYSVANVGEVSTLLLPLSR